VETISRILQKRIASAKGSQRPIFGLVSCDKTFIDHYNHKTPLTHAFFSVSFDQFLSQVSYAIPPMTKEKEPYMENKDDHYIAMVVRLCMN
jgi:hypothetical protein